MAKRTTVAQRAIEQFEAEFKDFFFCDEINRGEHIDWLAEGLHDATGYKVSGRQEVALQKIFSAGTTWIQGVLQGEALALICDEFRVFLSDAGLRGPHYKPPAGAHWFLQDTYEAYVSAKAWQRKRATGKAEEASQAAYHVGLFTSGVFFVACQPGTERNWNEKARAHHQRSLGGKAKAATYQTHRYQPEIDRLVQNGLTYSSAMEIVGKRFDVSKRHVDQHTENPRTR